jgi:hypothetical protein
MGKNKGDEGMMALWAWQEAILKFTRVILARMFHKSILRTEFKPPYHQ